MRYGIVFVSIQERILWIKYPLKNIEVRTWNTCWTGERGRSAYVTLAQAVQTTRVCRTNRTYTFTYGASTGISCVGVGVKGKAFEIRITHDTFGIIGINR